MNYWISAARLRTLPLSLSGIFMGSIFAFNTNNFQWDVFIMALLVAALLQVLSNFANDYGDGVRGTDKNKKGEARMVASGIISPKQMKNAVYLLLFITCFCGIVLLLLAFGKNNILPLLFGLFMGGCSILAAIYYTIGKNPYGYKGWGDFFVFLFFGWVAVIGANFLQTKEIFIALFLPASAIGFFSAAVLNLNNLRDYETDLIAKKRTLVTLLSISKAKIYHTFLLLFPFVLMGIFLFISNKTNLYNFTFLILLIPSIIHLKKVWTISDTTLLDSELKKIGILTFLFSLLSSLPFVF